MRSQVGAAMLYDIAFVWVPLVTTAVAAWVALRNIKAVLIITAAVGAVFYFFSGSPAPEPPPFAETAPPPPVAAYVPLPLPARPPAPTVQAAERPPCVAPPPKGRTTYYCDADGRLRFETSLDRIPATPAPGGSTGR